MVMYNWSLESVYISTWLNDNVFYNDNRALRYKKNERLISSKTVTF